jgi:hypothetical protein
LFGRYILSPLKVFTLASITLPAALMASPPGASDSCPALFSLAFFFRRIPPDQPFPLGNPGRTSEDSLKDRSSRTKGGTMLTLGNYLRRNALERKKGVQLTAEVYGLLV